MVNYIGFSIIGKHVFGDGKMTLIKDQKSKKYWLGLLDKQELKVMSLFLKSEQERHLEDIKDIEGIQVWIAKRLEEFK